jgi:ion channel
MEEPPEAVPVTTRPPTVEARKQIRGLADAPSPPGGWNRLPVMALISFLRRLVAPGGALGGRRRDRRPRHGCGRRGAASAWTGIWWAATTVTTVGYGDVVPASGGGRAIGFALMFSGAALFVVVAAVVASVIVVREVAAEEEKIESKEEEMLALLTAIDARLARLESAEAGGIAVGQGSFSSMMRTPNEIRAELDSATEERAELWGDLSYQHDASKSDRAAELSELIEELWTELRRAQAHANFGPADEIIARARAEDRLDRESERRYSRAA